MLIKTEIFGSKSSFQGKALNLGGWGFDQLFSSAKQFFPIQGNVIKFQVIWENHYLAATKEIGQLLPDPA